MARLTFRRVRQREYTIRVRAAGISLRLLDTLPAHRYAKKELQQPAVYFANLAQTMSYFRSKVTNIRQVDLDLQVNQCMVLLGINAKLAGPRSWSDMPSMPVSTLPRTTKNCSSAVW